MTSVFRAFGRALLSQLHFRMLLLTILPFLMAVLLWGLVLWLGWPALVATLQGWFGEYAIFQRVGEILGSFGLDALAVLLVPLAALWLLLPLMILSALLFVGLFTMPSIVRHVASRQYPTLEQRQGGSLIGSLAVTLGAFALFALLWVLTLPLNLVPPLIFFVQPVLWGWLTYQVMAYDALALHASPEERRAIMRAKRWPLLLIGAISGAMGAVPTVLWLGGAMALLLLPLLAGVAIWLYVLVFTFSGLWFQHYCLEALVEYRHQQELDTALVDLAPQQPLPAVGHDHAPNAS